MEWIKIADKLPRLGVTVLIAAVTDDWGDRYAEPWVSVGYYHEDGFKDMAGGTAYVTHWMPYPEPPKG